MLDLEKSPDGIPIFHKDTNTGLYVDYILHVTSIFYKSRSTRASQICVPNKSSELYIIKDNFTQSTFNDLILD